MEQTFNLELNFYFKDSSREQEKNQWASAGLAYSNPQQLHSNTAAHLSERKRKKRKTDSPPV